DGVETNGERMVIRWSKPGIDLPAVEVVSSPCEGPLAKLGPSLSFTPPSKVAGACPASLGVMAQVLNGRVGPTAIPTVKVTSRQPVPAVPIAIALGAALAGAISIVALRRRRATK